MLEVGRFLQIIQLVQGKQPTSARVSKAFSAHIESKLVEVAIKGRVAKLLSAKVRSCSPLHTQCSWKQLVFQSRSCHLIFVLRSTVHLYNNGRQ